MPLTADILDNIVPISDFSRGKASKAFSKVTDGTPVIVLKNNAPMAVITSPAEYARLTQVEEDYLLLSEALKRLEKDNSSSHRSLNDVMAEFEISEVDLDAVDDVEFE